MRRPALDPAETVELCVHMTTHATRGDLATLRLDLQVNLLAEDGHVARRRDAEPDLLTHDREDGDLHVVANHDALVGLSRQNQHSSGTSLYCLAGQMVSFPCANSHETSARNDTRRFPSAPV